MPSILLLDDEPNVLSALRRALRGSLGDGVRMELFTDPHEALARVAEHTFDVVVSDFRMPTMNGVEFLGFVRALQPDALRMIVSASTEISGVMKAINDVGVFRYVVKPWTTSVLVSDVHEAIEQSASNRRQRILAEQSFVLSGELESTEAERRRLEELEPGITRVDWGPNGEVLMPTIPAPLT